MRSLISERSPDGRILMEASWKLELKSYRSYKFNWVGRPNQPPDVYAEAKKLSQADGVSETRQTVVYVSWNGATEVSRWNLYKTIADGQARDLVASVPRQGFEANLTYNGLVSYVIVEGVDRYRRPLGESVVVKTIEQEDYLLFQGRSKNVYGSS